MQYYWETLLIYIGSFFLLPDGKEYDIYVSYARNAEEEEFVLLTLRGVLENEFGYKLCIFDRDSLPGGSRYLTWVQAMPPWMAEGILSLGSGVGVMAELCVGILGYLHSNWLM